MEQFYLTKNLEAGVRAVLISVLPKAPGVDHDPDPFSELRRLAETAEAEVVGELTQRLVRPDRATHLGRGKVEELKALLDGAGVKHVLCDQDLSPSQVKNLESATGARVIDRTELILDIFSRHAQTHQARLQVELARLEYILPRLKRMWTHFSRVRGGVGLRGGEGEKQIELDRRIIGKTIRDIQAELETIRQRRQRMVKKRATFAIALVGYTNAGKSSLFNRLADGSAAVADMLFKTLDTRTRVWKLPRNQSAVLSDTVGFIRDLPHHLVESFHATLEEIGSADLILHVIDGSDPHAPAMQAAVEDVLKQIGAADNPSLLVFNKLDAIEPTIRTALAGDGALFVSAKTGEGIDLLERRVLAILRKDKVLVRVELPAADGRTLAWLKAGCEVVSDRLEAETHYVTAWLNPEQQGRLRNMLPEQAVISLEACSDRELEATLP